MDTSILLTIEKMLGIADEDTTFDTEIIVSINSAIATLNQLGIGPSEGFSISDDSAEWDDLLGENAALFDMAKAYIYLKTRLVFDPPTSSFVLTSMQTQADELGWRLSAFADQIAADALPEVILEEE